MEIVDLIEKKKQGFAHSKEEIDFIINSMMNETAPDYQISAWLMAVYFKGMTDDETAYLTDAMISSGNVIDLEKLQSHVIDKNSTGGVGDKVSITLVPLIAAAGIPVVKLSGQSLGHTGGTIDKLESIPGLKTELSIEDIIDQAKKIGIVIASQTKTLTPADRKLYDLRNVTGTIDSMPLLASSVVSKKIAAGADNIILDVKYGSGAFMKTAEDAEKLARLMVAVGKKLNKAITAVITSMEEPLGRTVGNSLEVIEAIEFLKGNLEDSDIADLTYKFASHALVQIGKYDSIEDAQKFLKTLVKEGKAIEKFKELILKQKGNDAVIDNYDTFSLPQFKIKCSTEIAGYVSEINAYKIGLASKILGATRENKYENIDHSVGIFLNKKVGEYANPGDTIFTLYSNDEYDTENAKKLCYDAYKFSENAPDKKKLVYKVIRNTDNV